MASNQLTTFGDGRDINEDNEEIPEWARPYIRTLKQQVNDLTAEVERLKCEGELTHCRHWWDGEPCCACGHPGAGDEVTEDQEQCRHAFVPGESMEVDYMPVADIKVTKVFCRVCGNEDANPMHVPLAAEA